MKRPDPAVRHLLRRLDDPTALRKNPLAGFHFIAPRCRGEEGALHDAAVLQRIVAWVAAGAQALAAQPASNRASAARTRQRDIIVRCDLVGDTHKQVMVDLGLSRRQFYRERSTALARLDEILRQDIARNAPATAGKISEFETRLANAAALRYYARGAAVCGELRALAQNADDDRSAARALAALALAFIDRGHLIEATTALRKAQAHVAATPAGDRADREAIACADVAYARAELRWHSGEVRTALDDVTSAISLLRSVTTENDDTSAGCALVRALTTYASYCAGFGHTTDALRALADASSLLDGIAAAPLQQRATLLVVGSTVQMLVPGALSVAARHARDALHVAERNGLLAHASEASGNLCAINIMVGQYGRAAELGDLSVAVGRNACPSEDYALVHLNAARAHALAGNARRALALVSSARRYAPAGAVMGLMCDVAEAEVLLAVKRFPRALHRARRAVKRLEDIGASRYAGSAWRIYAEALEGAHRPREAQRAITSAVEILERRGLPFALAQAYAVSARLTRRRQHRVQARELFALMRI